MDRSCDESGSNTPEQFLTRSGIGEGGHFHYLLDSDSHRFNLIMVRCQKSGKYIIQKCANLNSAT